MIDPIRSMGSVQAIKLAGIDRVRERIAEIEKRFGIGGDNSFQATLEREMKKAQKADRAQAARASNKAHKSAEAGSVERAVDAVGTTDVKPISETVNEAREDKIVETFADFEQAVNEEKVAADESATAELAAEESESAAEDLILDNKNYLPGEEALNPFAAAAAAENPTPTPNTIREPLVEPEPDMIVESAFEEIAPSTTEEMLEAAADKYNVDPNLVKAIATAESDWDQNAVSNVGAIGVMQLMPETAAGLGVDPYDERENIEGGAKYIRQMLDTFDGNVRKAVAAYNAGPGAVKRYGGVPPYSETQNYVGRVLDLYE